MDTNTARLLKPAEAARVLSVSRGKIYGLMGTGELAFVKIGKATRIPATEVERFIAERLRGGWARPAGTAQSSK